MTFPCTMYLFIKVAALSCFEQYSGQYHRSLSSRTATVTHGFSPLNINFPLENEKNTLNRASIEISSKLINLFDTEMSFMTTASPMSLSDKMGEKKSAK